VEKHRVPSFVGYWILCFVYLTHILYTELFPLCLLVLCYVLMTRFMFHYPSYVCLNFLYVLLSFCVFCVFVLFCVFSPYVYSYFFSVCVQMYGLLPPGGNPIAVNKYHIIYVTLDKS
jgi:hypothetical protein